MAMLSAQQSEVDWLLAAGVDWVKRATVRCPGCGAAVGWVNEACTGVAGAHHEVVRPTPDGAMIPTGALFQCTVFAAERVAKIKQQTESGEGIRPAGVKYPYDDYVAVLLERPDLCPIPTTVNVWCARCEKTTTVTVASLIATTNQSRASGWHDLELGRGAPRPPRHRIK